MNRPSDKNSNSKDLRDKILGLSDVSGRKSYYPELTNKISQLQAEIEQRKFIEEALRESEMKYRVLVSNFPGIVYRCEFESDWKTVYISESVESEMGFPSSTFINGRVQKYPEIIHPDDVEWVYERILGSVENCEPVSLEYRFIDPNGNVGWLMEHVVCTRMADTDVKYIEGVILDITEQKKAQEQKETLLKRLDLKTKELESIVYVSSHDLRSPLVNIHGYSHELSMSSKDIIELLNDPRVPQDIRDKASQVYKEDIEFSLGFIVASVNKMDELLQGLMKLCRLGRVPVDISEINVSELIQEVISATKYQIEKSNIKFEVSDLPNCYADSVQLNQVFSNLIGNAIKYLDSQRRGLIKIYANTSEDKIIYCVEDNGIGISDAHKERVFEVFHRLDPSSKVSGEGLGLTIVRRILDRLGGRVWLESELGKGSKFYIELPCKKTLMFED